MARKRKAKRSRKKTPFNLTNAAMSLIVANGVSQGMFNVGLPTFLGLSEKGFEGGYSAGNNSDELSAKEILSAITGIGAGDGIFHGGDGMRWQGGITEVITTNIKKNAMPLIGTIVFVPMAFKLGKKVLGKPIINPTNRLLKAAGVGRDVKV